MKKTLILRPKKSEPGDGYAAFCPESNALLGMGPGVLVEISAQKMHGTVPKDEARAVKKNRRADTIAAITCNPGFDTLAIFSHGWSSGFQFGFDTKNVDELAFAIRAANAPPTVRVVMYCCGCGDGSGVDGDGGIADTLRDKLCQEGLAHCQVDAHTTVGHTTKNPWVRRFRGEGSMTGGHGGTWIVSPTSDLWRPWRRALASTDLRYRYPYLEIGDIHEELSPSRH